jgi:dipeptidyl aminopeptidase/acylaminoacyl peptidase
MIQRPPTVTLVREGRPGRPLRVDAIQRMPRPGDPAPSPDGRRVAHTLTTLDAAHDRYVSRLWSLDLEAGTHLPLTAAERHASLPRHDATGTRLAFLARPADDPKAPAQVHVLPLDGGEAVRVTDLPLGAFDMQFTADGTALIVGTWVHGVAGTLETTRAEAARRKERPVRVHRTERRFVRFWDRWLSDERFARLLRVDLATHAVEDLMPETALWFSWMEPAGAFDLRPDGQRLVFSAMDESGPDGRLRSDVYEIDLTQVGAPPLRRTRDEPGRSHRPRYLADGTSIVYGTTTDWDFYADRPHLIRQDGDGVRTPWMTDWDRAPSGWEVQADGTLLFEAEDDGRVRLFRLAPDAASPEALTQQGSATQGRALPDGRLVFLQHDLSAPPSLACRAVDGTITSWPMPGDGVCSDFAQAAVYDVRFEGARGDEIQMFVLRAGDAPEPTPLVHLVHGGPHGAFGDQWHARWNAQAFAADGATVALVNFHGSTGFGQAFAQCIQGAWGEMPAEDVHRATDVLVGLGWASPGRVAIAGGSYGGYLVSWLASTSDRFACAVNHAGVYDLAFQYGSDITFGRPRNMGGEIWEAPEAVDRWNPARHSAGLDTPMLVVHGERDFRVPLGHALVCYGILQARGVPARLVYFEDENHWVLQPANSRIWYEEVLGWIERFLGTPLPEQTT